MVAAADAEAWSRWCRGAVCRADCGGI